MDEPREPNTTTPSAIPDSPAHVYAPDAGEQPSEAVVAAVAIATDSDPLSLPPLYETIDPDALDSLSGGGGRGIVVSFRFAGYDVIVDGGTVLLVE